MKKVIFLAPHFLPRLGGVEKHIAAISAILHNRGWQVEVLTLQDEEKQPLQEKVSYGIVRRISLADQKNKKTIWSWIKNYFQSVHTESIIHVHDVGWWVLPQLLLSKKNKFYITFHGWEGQYPVRWQAKLHRLLISSLMTGRIHVGSFIQKYYWDKPTFVVYGGVDLPVKAELMPITPPLNIVFLGRLEAENQIDLYLEVLTKLAQADIRVQMTWVGDGKYRSVCEKWGKVTGMVKDVRKYTSQAHFIFASSYLSMLETQAQGKVVCAMYDHPLKKDYLESFPAKDILLLAGDADSMVEQIKNLTDNPEKYRHMSKKSAMFAQSQTWNGVVDVYEQLWDKR